MKNILFTHQGPHKVHGKFAETVTNNWYRYGDNHYEIIKNLIKSIFDGARYDVILVEGGLGLPHAVLKKMKYSKTRIVLLNADTLLYDLPNMNPVKKSVVKFLLSYVDGFIAISPLNKRIASQLYPEKPIVDVYPYGSNNRFDLNCDLNSNNILFIGNTESCKRFDLLVDAVEILNNRGDNFNLFLVGTCVDSVESDFPWLHKEGFIEDLGNYLKKCSLYVHPADFDSCPVTVFETMSAGMIPIITENVGEADILKDVGLECLLLDTNDPEAIADKIVEIHRQDNEWKKIVSDKCKEVTSNFNPKNQSKKFKIAFRELLDRIG